MALYAIGDLHLCLGAPKPMDVFGGAWVGYMDKLREGLSVITQEDTTILLGDLSWSLDLANAKEDLCILHPLPRVNEISVAVDKDPRACYFKQVQYGKYIRMALILRLLEIA